jgi:hypothetical protein
MWPLELSYCQEAARARFTINDTPTQDHPCLKLASLAIPNLGL